MTKLSNGLNFWKRIGVTIIVFCLFPSVAAAQSSELKQTGTVTINQTQIAFIVSGALGGGQLVFDGKTYPFEIAGLGAGGFGASSIEATGTVYNLTNLSDFEGLYGQARAGLAIIDKSVGHMWLENASGVYLSLKAKREGLILAVGADAIGIELK